MRQSAMIAGDVIEDRPRAGQGSIDRQWLAERELSNLHPESFAVLGHHLVAAFHRAKRRAERAERGVLVGLSGPHHGLFTDHAGSPNLLDFTMCVGDDPVSVEKLNRHLAPICDSKPLGEKPTTLRRQRTLGHVARADGDLDAPGCRFRIDHQSPPFSSARRIQPLSSRGDSRSGGTLILSTVIPTFQRAPASQWMWKQWRLSPCPSQCPPGRPCL